MATQAARRGRTEAAPKAPWKPRVEIIDLDEGTLLVQSETNPLKRYICNGKTGACNCKAATWNPETLCKHGRVAMATWPHLVNRRDAALAAQKAQEPQAARPALRLMAGGNTAKYGGAAGLMEAFGID